MPSSAASVDSMRKEVNRKVKQFLKSEGGGGLVIRYSNISFAHKDLFRYDGTHLNQLGNSVFLNDLQGGLETLLSNPAGMKVFPDDLHT